jgi:hypothetical protein
LEAGSSGALDRNRVCGTSNTTIKDIQTGRSVSTFVPRNRVCAPNL